MNFLSTLLQIQVTNSDSLAGQPVPVDKVTDQSISLLDLLFKGGWVMIPILILSVLAIYIIVERWITIRKASHDTTPLVNKVKEYILQGDVKSAKALCEQSDSPIARMLLKGIMRLGRPLKDIESSVEATGKIEIYKLEKNISVLGIIAGIAPMLGFVGTISGVIRIFYNIAIAGNIEISGIAEGLYEKMITSAAGLIVGIIAHIGYHYLNLMVERIIYKMESNSLEFIDLLQENK